MCLFLYMYRRILMKFMKKYPFLLFFGKNANVEIVEIQGQLSRKKAWLPRFFFVDFNSPCNDLRFLTQKNLCM